MIKKFIKIDAPPKTRYEIYLIGSLAETYRQMKEFDKAGYAYRRLLDITQTKGLVGWQCHACLGLAYLLTNADSCNTGETEKYLQSARQIYTNAEQAWGIINSHIVGAFMKQARNGLTGEDRAALVDIKNYASELQYSYETKVLTDILDGRFTDNYRLLFL